MDYASSDSGEGEDADAGDGSSLSDSGENDTICHQCSEPGTLAKCDGDGCHRSFHLVSPCMPPDAMPLGEEGTDWLCPVCTGSTAMRPLVANPLNLRGKGRPQQKRKKAAHEASKAQQREQRAQKKSRQMRK